MITQLDNSERFSKHDQRDVSAEKGHESWKEGYTGVSYDDLTAQATKSKNGTEILRKNPLSTKWRRTCKVAYNKFFGEESSNRMAIEGTACQFIKTAIKWLREDLKDYNLDAEMITDLMDHIPTIPPFSRPQWDECFCLVDKFPDIASLSPIEYRSKVVPLLGKMKKEVYDKWIKHLKGENKASQNSEPNVASLATKRKASNAAPATTTSNKKTKMKILEDDEKIMKSLRRELGLMMMNLMMRGKMKKMAQHHCKSAVKGAKKYLIFWRTNAESSSGRLLRTTS